MADKNYDPAVAWQSFLGEMERGFNAFANQAMGSSEFSKVMNQVSGTSIGAQRALGEAMERYLTGMNLPSRSQLTGLGERLQAIESQLNDIKAQLNQVHPGSSPSEQRRAAVPKPPRTRRPPPPKVDAKP